MEPKIERVNFDLTSCDREPVQMIGAIQGTGVLLAFRPEDRRIRWISDNCEHWLGVGPTGLLGRIVDTFLPPAIVDEVTAWLRRPPVEKKLFSYPGPISPERDERLFDCYLYRSGDLAILELEPQEETFTPLDVLSRMNHCLGEMKRARDLEEAARRLAAGIRGLTGMDRVMIYRFLPPSWHGEVIAEDRVASAAGFLGHRFPASDIPRPARDLYLRNRLRFIYDVQLPASNLVGEPNSALPALDLSDSRLRAVSPIHVQYLKNMHVASSMSAALVKDGQLWGLVACHHFQARRVSQLARAACESLAGGFSLRLTSEENFRRSRSEAQIHRHLRDLIKHLRKSRQPQRDFLSQHALLEQAFRATGVALVTGDKVDMAGLVPPRDELLGLARTLQKHLRETGKHVWGTDQIGSWVKQDPLSRADASGVLVAQLPGFESGLLMLFRPQVLQNIQWGGDPRKQLEKREFQGPINPRESFATWTETVEGQSEPWTEEEAEALEFLRDLVFETFVDREKLIDELNQKLLNPRREEPRGNSGPTRRE